MADKKIIKDDEFFYTLIVFQVEDYLFRVPRGPFIRESDVFRDMFDLPEMEDTVSDGTDESHPLRLDGIQSKEFRAFLRVLLERHRDLPNLSQEEWLSVLKLSHLWLFNAVREQAIKGLEALGINPVQQILVARQFDIPDWIPKAYTELMDRKDSLAKEEVEQLGWRDAFEVTHYREQRLEKLVKHFASGHERARQCSGGHSNDLPDSSACRIKNCWRLIHENIEDGCGTFEVPGAPKKSKKACMI